MADSIHREDQVRALGLHKEDLHRFGKILRIMNLDKIPEFASNIRQCGHLSVGINTTAIPPEPSPISCKVINPPLCGSYHIVFPIEFVDGMKWMLKVSVNGDHFNYFTAAALASEAQTMRMLKRDTDIPVPAVYAFDTSSDNALSMPFILMEKLGGRPLNYLWFNEETPKACLEHFRVKILQGLAGLMVQLNKFTVKSSGSLVFCSDGTPIGLRGAKVVDYVAEFNKVAALQAQQQCSNSDGDIVPDGIGNKKVDSNTRKASGNISNEDDIIYEHGPFSDPKAYFMANLDRPDPATRADEYERGTDMCLRLFIEWALANTQVHDRRFVLTHPDLDFQNILVADDGTITGLIDWDGVAAVPREVGCAQYPLWLMHDWVPSRYNYDTEKGEVFPDAAYPESSPAELASYRALYAHFMEMEIANMIRSSNIATTLGTLPKREAKLTRRSLIMRQLDLSAGDPWAALANVNHIIDHIEEITASDWKEDDSDTDSISSCSSTSDSDSVIDSDMEEEDGAVEAPRTNEHHLSGTSADISSHHMRQENEESERLKSGTQSLLKEAEGNCGSPISSDPSHKDFEELESEEVSEMPSSASGWMRRLLQVGFETAELSLRRLARIGYVPKDAVGQVADALAEGEAHNEGVVGDLNNVHVVDSKHLKREAATELSEPCTTEHDKDSLSIRNPVAQKQLNDVQSEEPFTELPNVSSVGVALKSDQIQAISNIEPQQIPVRKAELLKIARMEKKAEEKALYRAEKAAIKKELKVWEHIALAVWVRGVSLEQLRTNKFRIARWVVDTLQTEANGESLNSKAVSPSAAEATAAGVGTANGSAVDGGTTQSRKEPDKMFEKELTSKNKLVKKLDPSSEPSTAFGPHLRPARAKTPSSLRALWESGVSYMKETLYRRIEAEEDIRCPSPESTASSGSDVEDGGSDIGDARSSATSLSNGEGEEIENEEADVNQKPKTGNANPVTEDERAQAKTDNNHGQVEAGGTDGEDANEDAASEDEGDDSSTSSGPPDFIDHGGFDRYTVCNLLGRGELDELRMLRLKDGFLQLLERY